MGKAKAKTESVGAVAPTAVQPEEASEVTTSATESVAEELAATQPASTSTNPSYALVVCAYAGTEELVRRVWEQMSDEPFLIFSVADGDDDVRMIATQIIADDSVNDDFILVMPNTIPCSRIKGAELTLPVVYVDKGGKEHYSHRLPMLFSKSKLVELYNSPEYSADEESDEAFMRDYAKRYYSRPVQVSHNFGNYVTMVQRGNPCTAVVAEGIRRRKFICANAVGFKAIEQFIETLLSK